jgi:alkylation response protein AidB-like acyl-CoA dehydrogenase
MGHASAQAIAAEEMRDLLADATSRIFRELAEPQALASARDDRWRAPLWRALEDAGLTRAWVPEALGGSGAGIADGFEILRLAGSFAVPVPLAETLLAGWLLSQAGLEVPPGALSVAPVHGHDRIRVEADGRLSGSAREVPFARDAAHLALLAQGEERSMVALVERARCALEQGEGLSGEPRDGLRLERVAPLAIADAPAGFGAEDLLGMGAAVRAAQMSGALQAILERSVAYANERVAFERPIAKFQAIQHGLARLAGESAAALAAAGSAAEAIASGCAGDALLLEIAAAKIRAGEAAGEGAAIAHQVHGAIGFSREHALHRFTQRLWAWRDDFGAETAWAVRLGSLVAARGADALWPMLAAR